MLPDILDHELKVIFCGTAAGAKSAAIGHYYAGRGNRFWRTMHEIGLTDCALLPEEDAECLKFGFGFTDVAKGVAGMDRDIPKHAFDPKSVRAIIKEYSPRALAFNGKKAAQIAFSEKHVTYGLWAEIGLTNIWVLPSTSGAANAFWSIKPWLEMGKSLR